MHFLAGESVSADEGASAVDLAQSPADIVCLSFTDSDLSTLAAAWAATPEPRPTLRLASLSRLKHPYSVDLYVESVIAGARFVLIRLLGGLDYWRYGVDEVAACVRRGGAALAVLPGDHCEDPRIDAASTLDVADLRRLWSHFQEGGRENLQAVLRFAARPSVALAPPQPVAPCDRFAAACRAAPANAPRALIVFYRSAFLAADTAPFEALADALASRGFAVEAMHVTSLKDPGAIALLEPALRAFAPDVVLNTTAFSARLGDGARVLDLADAPVLQVMLAGASREAWAASRRGLGASDLAMNVVLPEIDGRIVTRAISFKGEARAHRDLEFTQVAHLPDAQGVAAVADLALSYARLRRKPCAERRIACILSDYPAKGGRTGYAVGLDTPQSTVAMTQALVAQGYDVAPLGSASGLMRDLTQGARAPALDEASYRRLFAALPQPVQDAVGAAWGDCRDDADFTNGAFAFRRVAAGKLTIAVQPDRGRAAARKGDYHDANMPPRHGYVAFYLWLRHVEGIDAMIQFGAHGTLEWLPGKAVAMSDACLPQALLGAVPVAYPFIVNNPGEAAQAKRRIGAVTIGHLTPPMRAAGTHGAMAEIEALLDEYAQAQGLDPARARAIAACIRERAQDSGLLADCGLARDGGEDELLATLDAWICDVKDMRIGDGLHVFGNVQPRIDGVTLDGEPADTQGRRAGLDALAQACAQGEMQGLARALGARFVPPGPAGAPAQGRRDVLPTGRNLYGVDPRALPTRTAWEIGRRTADDVLARHCQDHGDWPKAMMVDLWGSATMRTGGDAFAQALALIGVAPTWDHSSSRVSGFEVTPLAKLGRPRIDVTLRISGLFRDVFPAQVELFNLAVATLARRDEGPSENPLAAAVRAGGGAARIYGAAPGQYGTGLNETLASGNWDARDDLGAIYLAASAQAYEGADASHADAQGFRARVAATDAFVHVQDLPGQDIFDSDAFADHEGGFAAAAQSLGRSPALYHVDATRAGPAKVRTLGEEAARALRGRAVNPLWIAGQMRHGHRGAAEIAQTVSQVCAFAALSDVVTDAHFDALFDAVCADRAVHDFLRDANPEAARAITEDFDAAARRGLWQSRRNSVRARLADLLGATP